MVCSACAHCQAPFEPYPGKVYCDRICKARAKEKRRRTRKLPSLGAPEECPSCGDLFFPTRTSHVYCSAECRWAVSWAEAREIRSCEYCGTEFLRRKRGAKTLPCACKPPTSPREFTYLIAAGSEAIKIGCGGNLKNRLSDVQVSNHAEVRLLAKLPGGHATERFLHAAFADAHIRGEWYRPVPALLALAAAAAGTPE